MAKMIRRDDRERSMNVDESSLEFVSVLGRGGFGSVSLMRDSNFRFYAEKSSPFDHLKNLEKELKIMSRFRNHPRIIQASSPNLHIGIKPERCFIYMEFASKGTLHNTISEFRGRPMPEKTIGRVALMILQGLESLHSHGYVHCDLKPANVLLFPSSTFGEPWDLKLADFGLSKEPCTDSRSLCGGTKQYMPPESNGPNGVIGPAVDIWSLGCVVLQMFGGCPERMGDCYTWRLPKLVSPVADDFLRRCLALEPSRRATAAELLSHPFVAQRVTSVPPRPQMLTCPSFLKFPSDIKKKMMEEILRKGGPEMMRFICSAEINAIHRAAGPQLRAACYEVPEVRPGIRCPTGEARITPGFNLPASSVIHTTGPIYDADVNPKETLTKSYRNSLRVAKENNIKYIAFPAISCGIYGYPLDEAAVIGISTIKEFSNDFKEVHFVLFAEDIYSVWVEKAKELLQKA